MLTVAGWFSSLALLLSILTPGDADLPGAVADHDQHPGLGHPAEGDGNHEHGDPDDHHDTPDSPCHHHDTHTCCTSTVTIALVGNSMGPDTGNSSRIHVPTLQACIPPSVVEFLHVPIA